MPEENVTTHSYTVSKEAWVRALSMPPRPKPTRRQRLARWTDEQRYNLACWISPYGRD